MKKSTITRLAFFIALFIGWIFVPSLQAQTPDITKRLREVPIASSPSFAKRALIIGVQHYRFADPLPACDDDAHAVAELLQTRYKFPPESITLMTDEPGVPDDKRPGYTNMIHAVNTFLAGVQSNSEVVIFFSGHGACRSDEDWLVPSDGDPNAVQETCISYTKLKNRLETLQPSRALLLVDACRDLDKAKGVGSSGFGASPAPEEPQMAELMSCRRTEVSQIGSFNGKYQSVFTHFLLQGLSGSREALAENSNSVTFDSLTQFVQGKVSQYVQATMGAEQNPVGRASLGSMVLARFRPANGGVSNNPIDDGGTTKISPIDGAVMVFVPAGDFIMGSDSGGDCEKPAHKVYLDGYWIDKTPVTVGQYKKFCAATGHPMPTRPAWGWKDDHPIVDETWNDAVAYAAWAGKRLPTEAEWEKAARGTDGRNFPWGNVWNTNYLWISREKESDAGSTAPVGSFPDGSSPYGCVDMIGNVLEWCADWYSDDYYKASPRLNPKGPGFGTMHANRGAGSWCDVGTRYVWQRCRNLPTDVFCNFGFRCAQSESKSQDEFKIINE